MWSFIDWRVYYSRWIAVALVACAAACAPARPAVREVREAAMVAAAVSDDDADGTLDRLDACPHRAGPAENRGCPRPDADGDGVSDDRDLCATQPGPDGKASGCPVLVRRADSDGDGVEDAWDSCPVRAELRNGWHDDDGCPEELPPEIADFDRPLDDVVFGTGAVRLDAEAKVRVERAARILRHLPDAHVVVAGHADDGTGSADNQRRSLIRARAVRELLVARGVARSHIVVVSYGAHGPRIASHDGAARALGRRVELRLFEDADAADRVAAAWGDSPRAGR